MKYDTICQVCDKEFEWDEQDHEGNCPHCGAHYVIDFDCNDEWDAVLTVWFDPPANK